MPLPFYEILMCAVVAVFASGRLCALPAVYDNTAKLWPVGRSQSAFFPSSGHRVGEGGGRAPDVLVAGQRIYLLSVGQKRTHLHEYGFFVGFQKFVLSLSRIEKYVVDKTFGQEREGHKTVERQKNHRQRNFPYCASSHLREYDFGHFEHVVFECYLFETLD